VSLAARDAVGARAVVALIGNPNTGKTTLFNRLTGLRQQVGNYPGCTVERRIGHAVLPSGRPIEVIDLPGTYSLAARSPDELIAVDVLLGQQAGEEPADAVIAIVDASNLERNLYLVTQLLELDLPLVVGLNMTDLAARRGIRTDTDELAVRLGVPVIPLRADRGVGVEDLALAVEEQLEHGASSARGSRLRPGPAMPEALRRETGALHEDLSARAPLLGREITHVEAFRALVDRDGATERRLLARLGTDLRDRLEDHRAAVGGERSLASIETAERYRWIREVLSGCVERSLSGSHSGSDRVDAVLTHGVWGTLVLTGVLGFVFQAIYRWSAPVMDTIQSAFDWAGSMIDAMLAPGPLESLLVNGVIGGVGGVVVFLPQILTLFFFLALLEDCGYMARAAFLMDKVFARLGLSGRSMIPLLSSFACAVPGIMAVRSIEGRRQRLATMLIAPLMSCSARLPVYVLLIGAFVPDRDLLGGAVGLQGVTLLGAHVIGVVVAVAVLWILKLTLLKGPSTMFMLELPPYRRPSLRTVASRMLGQGAAFLRRAGTMIFAASIVVWALTYFPHPPEIGAEYAGLIASAETDEEREALEREMAGEYVRQSVMGRLGHAIEPAVRPLGWDWRIGMAVLASFPAREVVIATMGTIFNLGEDVDETSSDLADVLGGARWPDGSPLFNLPVALSLIVFFALCCQCVSTLAVILRESGSWAWVVLTFLYMTTLAYAGAFIAYQLTRAVVS
jgi:ferrous iron transport protein B